VNRHQWLLELRTVNPLLPHLPINYCRIVASNVAHWVGFYSSAPVSLRFGNVTIRALVHDDSQGVHGIGAQGHSNAKLMSALVSIAWFGTLELSRRDKSLADFRFPANVG